jgi:hypothetical protein
MASIYRSTTCLVPLLSTTSVLPLIVEEDIARSLCTVFTPRAASWLSARRDTVGWLRHKRGAELPNRMAMVRPCPLYLYAISPIVSTPAGPPPAIRIVFAVASLVFYSLKAEVVSVKEKCRVQRALLDVVPVVMMRELD